MAIVWRGWDTRLDREVAIKEPVAPTGALAGEIAERFVREGRAAAALNHPGIVTIYSADAFDGQPAIVMELIEGETLSTVLERGALAAASAAAVLGQLLDAVSYAHEHGVVHRDIKPDNIFITHDGRVKLTDFGIAHVGTSALTQAGTIMGTPGYMAPEQVLGSSADVRADVFAIGVVGYEMLSGRNPFGASDGQPPTTVMYRVVHDEPPQLACGPDAAVPDELGGLVSIAMTKDPAGRFQTAEQFRRALRDLSWAPPAARAPMPAAPGSASGRPAWLPFAAAGVLGAIVVGVLLAASVPKGGGAATGPGGASVPETAEPGGEALTEIPPEPAVPDTVAVEQELRVLLEEWRVSRETLDFETYMAFYSTDFRSADGKEYSAWRANKQRIYAGGDYPTITFGAPAFTFSDDGGSVSILFHQAYRSNGVKESGTKKVQLRLESDGWKIISESV